MVFQYLRQKNAELEEKYEDSEVPMPDYWWAFLFFLELQVKLKRKKMAKL